MTTKTTKAEKLEARKHAIEMLSFLKPSDVVYTKLDSVSSSGMSRQISVYVARVSEEGYYLGAGVPYIQNITYFVSKVLDRKIGSKGGVSVSGCGMDMGFEVVYNLGRALFPEGFNTSETYKSLNKVEIEALYNEGYRFERARNGCQSGWDRDGGYALKQLWL